MSTPTEDTHFIITPDDSWLMRPCEFYYEEMKDCEGLRGRLHQNYVHGHKLDCTSWVESYKNCMKFRKDMTNIDALTKVVDNEKARREERLKGARGNDVWEYRVKPPDDWNSPLPPDKIPEKSLLAYYETMKKERAVTKSDWTVSGCSVS